MAKKKFVFAQLEIHLQPYGHEITYVTTYGKDRQGMTQLRDYGSDDTGELVFKLLANLAVKDWDEMEKLLKKIRELEG